MNLEIRNLNKTYPNGVRALQDVDLDVPRGMFGLLGPNGAGKSSLMRTIATLQEADSGTITLGTVDVLTDKAAVRAMLGYLPQQFGLYPKARAMDLLDYFAVLKGITKGSERKALVKALLERVNLWDHRKKKLGGFSGGMRQRFGIAVALIGDPKLIIVDEPTAGLDPAERERFHNLLAEIGENAVVILSTHIVEDVHNLCSQMAVMHDGQIRLVGRPAEVTASLSRRLWTHTVERDEVAALRERLPVISSRLSEGKVEVRVVAADAPVGFEPAVPTLEDVYFTVMAGLWA